MKKQVFERVAPISVLDFAKAILFKFGSKSDITYLEKIALSYEVLPDGEMRRRELVVQLHSLETQHAATLKQAGISFKNDGHKNGLDIAPTKSPKTVGQMDWLIANKKNNRVTIFVDSGEFSAVFDRHIYVDGTEYAVFLKRQDNVQLELLVPSSRQIRMSHGQEYKVQAVGTEEGVQPHLLAATQAGPQRRLERESSFER